MKKLFAISFLGSSLLIGIPEAKSEWDNWGITQTSNGSSKTMSIYKVDTSNNNNAELFGTKTFTNIGAGGGEGSVSFDRFDQVNGLIIFKRTNPSEEHSFNLSNGNWVNEGTPWTDSYINTGERPIITKKANGEFHIGINSWITKEENGRQKVYAKDAAGNPIPIDYTNGTKLLINGRDVDQSINNIGALSAALAGLPTVPTDTTLACGLGTGTHGGDFAFSGGCASKVNEKLSINYAASITMPGQDYAGDFEDTFSARAGFVWKLGKSNQPTQISFKAKEKMEDKINSLEEKNKKILFKNQKLENTLTTLLVRLERLENIAHGESKSKDLATLKLQ